MSGHSLKKYLDSARYLDEEAMLKKMGISRDMFYKMKKMGIKFGTIQWGHAHYYDKQYILKHGKAILNKYFNSIAIKKEEKKNAKKRTDEVCGHQGKDRCGVHNEDDMRLDAHDEGNTSSTSISAGLSPDPI